ncbi:MAG: hypothetical protein IRY92_08475 [Dactylosporangium sp.]|nr:hypothetical protein [Dactylosporangium sp.]
MSAPPAASPAAAAVVPPPAAAVDAPGVQEVRSAAGTQPVVQTQPATETQPAIKTQPAPETQPAIKTQPAPETQPAIKTQPAPETRPAEGTGPAEPTPVGRSAPVSRGRRLVGTVTFGAVVVLLLAAIGYLVYQRFYADPTKEATAGDCLADLPIVADDEDREVPAGRIVACTDPAARYVVEGRLDRLTEEQARSETICQAYENAKFVYRVVPRGGTGYVLCLRALDT